MSCAQSREARRGELSLESQPEEPVDASDSFDLVATNITQVLWITYSTVTDFARLRGWSTSVPLSTAT
jgi:hypothetical protein